MSLIAGWCSKRCTRMTPSCRSLRKRSWERWRKPTEAHFDKEESRIVVSWPRGSAKKRSGINAVVSDGLQLKKKIVLYFSVFFQKCNVAL